MVLHWLFGCIPLQFHVLVILWYLISAVVEWSWFLAFSGCSEKVDIFFCFLETKALTSISWAADDLHRNFYIVFETIFVFVFLLNFVAPLSERKRARRHLGSPARKRCWNIFPFLRTFFSIKGKKNKFKVLLVFFKKDQVEIVFFYFLFVFLL